eukprot:CAMPEP_0184691344 /NCGR_PEP_ID=MMETSP0313-20130426/235_1 /TAXON_ID=2792 /ORGANISM="Porphyridium aerugineum, Strain SAG 1380-2" /LENGTH=1513 /DNA_ID=CAMNT_0027149041 /DNA_START=177 /DNA_END=4718 /DNA_ORIENTATION=+
MDGDTSNNAGAGTGTGTGTGTGMDPQHQQQQQHDLPPSSSSHISNPPDQAPRDEENPSESIRKRVTIREEPEHQPKPPLQPPQPAAFEEFGSDSGSLSPTKIHSPTSDVVDQDHSDDHVDDDDDLKPQRKPSPEIRANIISRIFLLWVFPIIITGWRKPLQDEDMWELAQTENSEQVVPIFAKIFEETTPNKKGRKFVKALYKSQKWLFYYSAMLYAMNITLGVVQPVLLNGLLSWLQSPNEPMFAGYLWAVSLLLAPLLKAVFENHYFLATFRGGIRLRAGIQGMVYTKALRMSPAARSNISVGKIVNLMQLDAEKIATFVQLIHAIWGAPVQFVVSIGLLYNYIGPSSLIGLAFTIFTIPLQAKLIKTITTITRRNTNITDSRVKLTNEILQGIKAVKFYAWERPFSKEVDSVRAQELENLRKMIALKAGLILIMFAIPSMVAVITFTFYIAVFEHTLNPAIIFTALSLLNNLRIPLMMFPFVLNSLIDSKVSAKRLEKFLELEETDDYARSVNDVSSATAPAGDDKPTTMSETVNDSDTKENGNTAITNGSLAVELGSKSASKSGSFFKLIKDTGKRGFVEIRNGTFTWGSRGVADFTEIDKPKKKAEKKPLKERLGGMFKKKERIAGTDTVRSSTAEETVAVEDITPVLQDINLTIAPGELVAIIGRVGSGKSSLAQAVLGEIKKLDGQVTVHGSVAYVPQTAWIFNGTLKENVLFGYPYDDQRYAQALFVSCLEADLEVLPGGDMTAIGEKGINLSGGQKQRVSIARAVYADRDVYVFDDPLSALDAHVGKSVFNHCISNKGILRNSARVLVTNQLQFVPKCDKIVLVDNGRIAAQGSYRQLMESSEEFNKLMNESNSVEEEKKLSESDQPKVSEGFVVGEVFKQHTARLLRKVTSNLGRKDTLMMQEERNTGNIGTKTYLAYAKSCGGYLYFCFIICFFAFTVTISVLNNWWLSYWSQTEETHPERYTTAFYLGIYFAMALGFAVFTFIRTCIFLISAQKASKQLHERCYFSVTHAPMEFFDTTPIGRIISRFARDVSQVDTTVPQSWQQFLNSTLNLLSSYILIAVVTPLFIAVAVPIGIMYWLLQRFYNRTNLEVKRLDSISKSPIYAHFSETLGGLSTIRAYAKQDEFKVRNLEMVNGNNRANFVGVATNRWFSLWLEVLGSILIFAAAIFGVIAKGDIYTGLVGLSLTYALQVTSFLGFAVRSITELEAQMNSVERLEHYSSRLPQEAPHIIDSSRPPLGWPSKGHVYFQDLELRYRKELDLVLKGVTLDIAPGTKVGVVGRTGAGKSSLMVALLRLVEPTRGTITVDGVDITTIGLEDLRHGITIIPQDPVMFSGSIRFNIDPFKEYEDAELWNVLDKAHLKGFVSQLEGGLDGRVSEYGENLSAGQRQLICLARALLRKPRVLIMDEATSSVDHETDQMIQETVRSEFSTATILTIAHRLWTIADYDTCLVMANGEVGEYAPPIELLRNEHGLLTSMVNSLGVQQSQNFKELVSKRSGLIG